MGQGGGGGRDVGGESSVGATKIAVFFCTSSLNNLTTGRICGGGGVRGVREAGGGGRCGGGPREQCKSAPLPPRAPGPIWLVTGWRRGGVGQGGGRGGGRCGGEAPDSVGATKVHGFFHSSLKNLTTGGGGGRRGGGGHRKQCGSNEEVFLPVAGEVWGGGGPGRRGGGGGERARCSQGCAGSIHCPFKPR